MAEIQQKGLQYFSVAGECTTYLLDEFIFVVDMHVCFDLHHHNSLTEGRRLETAVSVHSPRLSNVYQWLSLAVLL